MPEISDALSKDLKTLDRDELLDTAEIFKKSLEEHHHEKIELEDELRIVRADHRRLSQRVLSFPSSTSSTEVQPYWIRAEVDSPRETSQSCFGQRNKYRTVIVCDQKIGSLEARSRELTKDEPAGIYSKLPSRICNTFHVYHACPIASETQCGLQEKFWVSTKMHSPSGYVLYCSIHFSRLSWKTRISIWTGRIKWLYILPPKELKEKKGY